MEPLRLRLFGGFELCHATGEKITISGIKAKLLLAYLSLRPNERPSRDQLMALMWSGRGEEQARGSLRQAIWAIRHSFDKPELCPLVVEGDCVALDVAAVDCDVAAFKRLAQDGTVVSLAAALDLYKEELLAGIRVRDPQFEAFLRDERQRLQQIAVECCTQLLDGLQMAEADNEAAATARQLLAIDPLQESTHRVLMMHYARRDQVGMALRQYQTCCEVLQRELQVEPSAETTALFDRIRQGQLLDSEESATEAKANIDRTETANAANSPAKPSIAVLPFANLSGDPEQEYFSDGITEDIITALSRLRWFLVIARNSTLVYKDKVIDAKDIGRELGVRYLLEGSVRKAGNRLRITAQLVDTSTGAHHWAERYDRDLTDIFELQDEITQSVTAAIEPKLVAAEGLRAESRSADDLGAWEMVMQALTHFGRMTTPESEMAIETLRQAVQKFPNYGPAHSLLAFALLVSGHVGWSSSNEIYIDDSQDYRDASRLAQRAAELDHEDPWAHLALGYLAFTERDTSEAVRHYKRALDLNPNFATAYGYLGWALVFDTQSNEAVGYFQQALRMSPHDPLKAFFYSGTGVAHYYANRYEEAAEWARNAIRERPGFAAAHRILCASLAMAGQQEETQAAMKRLRALQPNLSISWIEQYVPYTERAMPHFLAGMRKAGLV